MKNPVYEFEIKAFHCSLELWINDILVFNHFEENGSVWVDWPINHYLMKSGLQNFEIRLIPYKGQTLLSEKVVLEVGIHATEESFSGVSRIEVIEKASVEIANVGTLPAYIHKGVFNVTVPYELEGYKNSVDLSKEKKEELFAELIKWNSKLLNIFKTADLAEYNRVYKKRDEEYDKSNYIPSVENTSEVFHSQFTNLVALPNDAYKLFICGQGKLASVKLPYELPGFTYEPSTKDEDSMGFSFNIYFHRKAKGEPLEIVK